MKSDTCLSYFYDPPFCKTKVLILRYVKNKENLSDYSSGHFYKDLLQFKELIQYVYFVADDTAPKILTICMIIKATKNDKPFHQIIKLAR